MSHIHDGPLATYNSLTDKNLSGYFSNSRMRKHLRKSGLVNRRGVIVSENQYRLNMARKEHKKHVKELLAQAIVHKTLDMERTRQVEIRRKLEEIAKIELVRRVRANNKRSRDSYLMPLLTPRPLPREPTPLPTPSPPPPVEEEEEEKTTRGRKGDEEILPYLSPRPSRPSSRPATATEHRYRPRSAPSRDQYEGDTEIVYVDDRGRRLSPSPSHREVERPSKGRPEEIDTKHLYALDTAALRKYALHLSRIEQGEGSVSPYLQSPVPTPPRSARSSRTGTASLRIRQRPRTAETRDTSPYGDRKHGEVQSSAGSSRNSTPRGTPQGTPRSRRQQQRVVEGTLMLHRQEPAMMHQGEVQTLCEITMKYHGPNLTLPRDQHDPCQNINIDQQHCGGNTLPVFKEALKPGDSFSFVSRRHRGYPFSLSIFVDGRIDSRVSTCCEYRHAKGVKLGGKMGHFSLLKVTGATPCYKCKLISQATPRSLRRPPSTKSKGKPEELKEDVIVVDRKQIQDINDEAEEEEKNVVVQVEDDLEKGKVKHESYIDPDSGIDLRDLPDGKKDDSKDEAKKRDAKNGDKKRVKGASIVPKKESSTESEADKYESDSFEESDGEDNKKAGREIRGEGNDEDWTDDELNDEEKEQGVTEEGKKENDEIAGEPGRCSTPLPDTGDEVDSKDKQSKNSKQVRFKDHVQQFENSDLESREKEEDDNATKEDVVPATKDADEKLLKELLDDDDEDAVDTCDEVSDIETDMDTPRKASEQNDEQVKVEEVKGEQKKEEKEHRSDDSSSSVDSRRCYNDDHYSDDFENSDNTIKSGSDGENGKNGQKCDSKETTKTNDKTGEKKESLDENETIKMTENESESKRGNDTPRATRQGEYYDEEYACDDVKDSHASCKGTYAKHDGKDALHDGKHQDGSLTDRTGDTVSIKSYEDEKKYYLDEDDSEHEELAKGPLSTTFEDMNIIGPLATLLVKVRRKRRERQSLRSVSDDDSSESSIDGANSEAKRRQNDETDGLPLDSKTAEREGSTNLLDGQKCKMGSLTSLSSEILFDQLPTGKKRLDPIKKTSKKRKERVSSARSEGRISSADSRQSRGLTNSSNESLDSLSKGTVLASQEVIKAMLESNRQMALSVHQVAQSSKLVVESSKEVLESSKQVNMSSHHVNESSKQVNVSSKQIIESSKQVIESAMHAVEHLKKTSQEMSGVGPESSEPKEKAEKEQPANVDLDMKETGAGTNEEMVIDELDGLEVENEREATLKNVGRKLTVYDDREHADIYPEEDHIHKADDTNFHEIMGIFDTIPEPDNPHVEVGLDDVDPPDNSVVNDTEEKKETVISEKDLKQRRMTLPSNIQEDMEQLKSRERAKSVPNISSDNEELKSVKVLNSFLYMKNDETLYTEKVEVKSRMKKMILEMSEEEQGGGSKDVESATKNTDYGTIMLWDDYSVSIAVADVIEEIIDKVDDMINSENYDSAPKKAWKHQEHLLDVSMDTSEEADLHVKHVVDNLTKETSDHSSKEITGQTSNEMTDQSSKEKSDQSSDLTKEIICDQTTKDKEHKKVETDVIFHSVETEQVKTTTPRTDPDGQVSVYRPQEVTIVDDQPCGLKSDEKRDKKSSSSSSSSKSSSRSSSRSSHSDSDEEKFDRNAVKHIVYEDKKKDDKRQVIGMQADGDRERESLRSKDTDSVTDVNVPGRKIDGYSDDEEYPDGPKYRSEEPYSMATKVTPEIEKPQERGRGFEPRKRDDSASSRSSSSGSSRSRSRSPVQEKRKSPSPVYDRKSPSPVYGRRSPSPVYGKRSPSPVYGKRSPSPKERKSPSPRSVSPVLRRSPSPERKRRGSVSSRSSTSSVHISDSEEEKELPKVKVEEIPKRRSSSSSSSSSSDDERRRKRKEEDVGRTPSPFPEAFSYTSYKEELSAKEKREEELRASPLPGPYRYQKMYEDSDNEITQTIEVQAEPLPEPASYEKLFETSGKETVASMSRNRKSSSSSSGSVSSTGKGKVVTATIEPVKRASPIKSSSSSSSDSSSESESEKKKPELTKVTESPKKTEPVKSSSSSSSDSSTESERGKKEPAQTRTAEPVEAAELPKTESAKKSASSSSDSSRFSSSSESDSEDENKKKTSDAAKPPLPKPPSPKLEVQTKETTQTEKKSAKSGSDSSGSSDSSSDSDSDSEEDTDRKPKQGVTTPAPEVKATKVPTPPTEPKAPEKKQDSSDSSSGSESDTESSETETDRSKEAKVKSKEAVDGPRMQQLATATTEHVEKKQSEQPTRMQQEVKKDASDSDSDTSSSDSSDSSDTEEENKKKTAADKKSEQQKAKDSDSDNESKKIISMVTSESEAEQKKVSIFASESDGENMHGGNDPDKVADDTAKSGSFMSRIGGVKPAAAHPGPLLPVFDGKKDLEVTNIKLDNAQVIEIAGYIEKKDHVKTFCLRNAGLDDDKFDGIASALINSKSEIKMVNLNLNNLKTSSADKLVEVLVEKPSVDILLLHGNPLGDDGVKKLVDGLLDLHEASQSHKEESDTSLDYCRLQELDLGDTSIQDDGIGHIARLLETDTSLQTLNLNGNPRITINGWKKLGRALKKNTNLTTLTLDFNKIGDDGLSALISGLKDNQTLKTLDLEDTSLTQDGGRKLVELLKCNTTILDITVSPGNSIPEKLRDEIRNYLGLNQAAAQPSRFKN